MAARQRVDPRLVHATFKFDYNDHLTLRGSTLLHVAVEYDVKSCVDVLLEHGADLNAKTLVGRNGVGGQTPIFRVIGSNQDTCYSMFEYLLKKNPDLSVRTKIQENPEDDGKIMDCTHERKDHFFDKVLELMPLGYALKYENEPEWRSAASEVAKLHELGKSEG